MHEVFVFHCDGTFNPVGAASAADRHTCRVIAKLMEATDTGLAAVAAGEAGRRPARQGWAPPGANLLEKWTRERVPLGWAMIQHNLGSVLRTMGERENGTARLEEAVLAFRAALEERTRERVPHDWAQTQFYLGNTLQTLGNREGGTEPLAEAVTAYLAALEEWTRERLPLEWAAIHFNLGNISWTLGNVSWTSGSRESAIQLLEKALAFYGAALEERTRERVPLDWSRTQDSLGGVYTVLGSRTGRTDALEAGRNAIALAWEGYREVGIAHYDDYFKERLAAVDNLLAEMQ